jgi:hypothetical protein
VHRLTTKSRFGQGLTHREPAVGCAPSSNAGRSIAEVAELLGRQRLTPWSSRAVVLTSSLQPAPRGVVDVDAVRRLLAAGESLGEIGRQLGQTLLCLVRGLRPWQDDLLGDWSDRT